MSRLLKYPYNSWWWRRQGINGANGFDPITNDPANNQLILDGEIDLTVDGWADQSGNGNDMVFPRSATLITVNGLSGVRHTKDTAGQYGQTPTPAIPVDTNGMTIYFVYRVQYTGNRFPSADTRGANWVLGMRCSGGAPLRDFTIGSLRFNKPVSPVADWTWCVDIFKIKGGAGDTGSGMRQNDTAFVPTINVPTGHTQHGMVLSADNNGANFTSCTVEWAYVIMRNTMDDTDTQDQYLEFFNNRYALWV